MGVERDPSSGEKEGSGLEKYKGSTDAPFEVVDKDEELSSYPYSFLKKLKANWTTVCDLMDWKKTGTSIDWNFFRVAKDPFQVVTSIQDKILKQGGLLPKYGADGKFGTETENALDYVTGLIERKEQAVAIRARDIDVAPDLTVTPAVSTVSDLDQTPKLDVSDEKMRFQQKLMRLRGREMLDSFPKMDARLKAADLYIYADWVEGPGFDEISVKDFQARARKLRETLVQEEPKLESLTQFFNKFISVVENNPEKIDLYAINSIDDLVRVCNKITKTTEELLRDEKSLGDKAFEKLVFDLDLDIEIITSLVMAVFLELLVLIFKYSKKDEQNFTRIINVLKRMGLIRRRSFSKTTHDPQDEGI